MSSVCFDIVVLPVFTCYVHKIYETKNKLEWGCPNRTKYPPRQPIPNRAILPNRARLQTDGRTDRRTDRVIPVYPP